MYLSFFGLREKPFELTANPRYLFFTGQHREALSNLEYGLSSAKAITVLIGEAGTGKTTLLRAALESERCRHVRAVFIHNPTLTRNEFIEILAHELQLGSTAGQSKASLLGAIEKDLRERRDNGQITALVVDEAQGLSDELLEEIEDLGLDRHVQRTHGLVGDDDGRLDRERTRDRDALALAPRELPRTAA